MNSDSDNNPAHDVLIAFGSNLGDPREQYKQAVDQLTREITQVSDQPCQPPVISRPFETAPVGGPPGQPVYINGAIRLQTELEPQALHACLIKVEQSLGRERSERWGARRADLDLLLFDDVAFCSAALTIPHPRMSFRRFVLHPVIEIAADMVHPVSGLTLQQLVEHLDSRPDKILVADENRESPWDVDALQKELDDDPSLAGWTLSAVSSAETLEREFPSTKLIAFHDDHSFLSILAAQLPGPTLRISGRNQADFRTEVLAAIQAMTH